MPVGTFTLDTPSVDIITTGAMSPALALEPALVAPLQSQTFLSEQSQLPSETHAILPALSIFFLEGESGYLEDLMARIDAPRLRSIDVIYSNQLQDGDPPQKRYRHSCTGCFLYRTCEQAAVS